MARRIQSLRRKVAYRSPKKKFILFCEGRNTEPTYFRAIGVFLNAALIEIQAEGGSGTPWTIAERSVQEARQRTHRRRRSGTQSFESEDEVWAVFDRDEHPRFQEAVNYCNANGVSVARSNPCFELWLILHFADFEKDADRHEVQRALRDLCPEYDPNGSKTVDALALLENLEAAISRAEKQLELRIRERSEFGPPSTTVGQLVRSLLDAAKGYARLPAECSTGTCLKSLSEMSCNRS